MTTIERPSVDERAQVFNLVCDALVVTPEVIHDYGFHTAEEGIGEFPDHPVRSKYFVGQQFKYSYLGRIGRDLAEGAVEAAGENPERYIRSAFDSGMSTIGAFLRQGVQVYADHQQAQGQEPTTEGLAELLHRSLPAVARFARTNNHYSRLLEGIYGLGGRAMDDWHGQRGFHITSGDAPRIEQTDWEHSLLRVTGRLALTDDPEVVETAKRQIFGAERCGAYEQLMPASFHWAVDFAAATHEFFPSDIAGILEDKHEQ
jgi:hypothetical protein